MNVNYHATVLLSYHYAIIVLFWYQATVLCYYANMLLSYHCAYVLISYFTCVYATIPCYFALIKPFFYMFQLDTRGTG